MNKKYVREKIPDGSFPFLNHGGNDGRKINKGRCKENRRRA